ncbi:MAG: hypothetical protein JWR83_3416 [Aeromicrobium sp.]|nr:hypothetical protein [Aeromicrobium sp.]
MVRARYVKQMHFVKVAIGAVVTLFGIIFMLQGLDVIGGSGMSGKTLWAILGPIIAIVGLVVIVRAVRQPPTREDLS